MKKLMFFRPLYSLGGTEIAMLNLVKKLKGYDIYIGYSDLTSDKHLLDRFAEYATIINLNEVKDFEVDAPSFDNTFGDAEESLDGVSGSIKKIKKQLMGFDELNIINNPDADSGSGSGGVSGGGAGLDLKPLEYDFLKGLKTEKLDEIKTKLETVAKVVSAIGIAFGTWKIAQGIVSVFNTFSALGGVATTIGTAFKSSGIIAFFTLNFSKKESNFSKIYCNICAIVI